MTKKIAVLFVLLGCFILASANTEIGAERTQQSVLLKMNLKKGASYLFSTNIDQLVNQEVMGNKMDIKQQTQVDYLYQVLENNAQDMKIKCTYQNMSIHMETPQGDLHFDSKSAENAEGPLKPVGNMVGKSFFMYLNPEGEVTKVEGMQEILNAIGGDATTQQMLKQQFSDSAFMNMMNISLNIYPNKEMQPNETWQKDFQMPMAGMMEMDLQNRYTLTNLSGKQADIAVQSDIKLSPLSGSPLGAMEFNLTGTQTGAIQVDTSTGLINTSKIHQKINGDISAQGMKIPMQITSEITLTGREL
ncbi:DUF6263 family protein [Olivibacter sp. XZL3]|uniref:DUF6263 family protein n=1 Tax=Olivibacter sp. XZL3 TaxID=1735116 RepID=UPI001065DC94|nr:DUF6263 family protein [Olivibacter sp. XZL3]